jgi:hypothetical protein
MTKHRLRISLAMPLALTVVPPFQAWGASVEHDGSPGGPFSPLAAAGYRKNPFMKQHLVFS